MDDMKHLTINFLGDSITEGAGAPNPDATYLAVCAKLAHATAVNYGLSGTRIARQKVASDPFSPDEDFILRARWMNPCDFLFVFGGTNDFGHGDAPLGQRGDDTPWTFYGALRVLCEYLLNAKGLKKEQICFILPTPREDQESHAGDGRKNFVNWPDLEGYKKVIKEVVSSYGIDIFESSIPTPPLGVHGPSEYYVDGLHPNEKGHRYLGEELYRYLKGRGLVD